MANGKTNNVLAVSGLSGKSVTGVVITYHGSVVAIDIQSSSGSEFIKVKHGMAEVGGTNEWGTGTLQQ